MRTISALILVVIADANDPKVESGDVKNAHPCAENGMKVHTSLGKEFNVFDEGTRPGTTAEAVEALCGLVSYDTPCVRHLPCERKPW